MVENQGVQGYVVGPGEGVSGHGPGVMATRVSTGGALTVIELEVRDGPPWHVHTREEESFYVLDGSLRVHCGDDIFDELHQAADPTSRAAVLQKYGIQHP